MRCTSAIDASIMAMASLEGAALPAAAAVAALKGIGRCLRSKTNLHELENCPRGPRPEARDQATLSLATLGLRAATMSQMYSQMSQIGDELDGDAAFGEFAAAWDSHTPAVHAAAALAPQEASEVTHAGGGQLGPAKQAQILKRSPYSDFNLGCVRTRALTFQSFCHCTRSQSLTKEESSASALFFSKFAAEDSGARCVCVCVCVCVCINIRYIYCICVCICIYLGYLNPKP